MFDFNDNVFGNSPRHQIPPDTQVIFVSDMFVSDYVGGAELTSQALIDSCPLKLYKLRSREVTPDLVQQGVNAFWIFGNFTDLNPQLFPMIVANLRYSVLEYDYKYCRTRSPEKHLSVLKVQCDCNEQMNGKMISTFFYGAMHLWWMSEGQKEHYHKLFPFLSERSNTVLSSVFDTSTLGLIKALRLANEKTERKGWIVLGSNSWIKGAEAAVKWCADNGKEHEVVWNVPYDQLLEKLAKAEGFVYLPPGGDTCPRMVIEAKLLGCKLHLNDNVQHKDEEWFATDDVTAIEEYLSTATKTFWNGIKVAMDYKASVSGYTTTLNCIKQQYPFEQCIRSMLEFCDEVCVVDGGSTDGTLERLVRLAVQYQVGEGVSTDYDDDAVKVMVDFLRTGKEFRGISGSIGPYTSRLRVKVVERDWNHPRFAVFDGMQKAEARAMCMMDFCWQMDSDEIVHEDDAKKILELCRAMPKEADILALPVIEYWGGPSKVRLDIQPWKWRLSRNKPNTTHGIPKDLRVFDSDGNVYANVGTDGCDMIDKETGERLQHISFYTHDVENVRKVAMIGNDQARKEYERWFNTVINGLPCVFHYSWYDLPRKIRLYRDYWTRHWNSLYGRSIDDTAENNMMFDLPWSEVTEEMIEDRVKLMKEKLGGWIWHSKWDGKTTTQHITVNRNEPKIMKGTRK